MRTKRKRDLSIFGILIVQLFPVVLEFGSSGKILGNRVLKDVHSCIHSCIHSSIHCSIQMEQGKGDGSSNGMEI